MDLKYSANIMKIFLILGSLLSFNFLYGQDNVDEEGYTYSVYSPNKNMFEGGLEMLIPQGDFKQKTKNNKIGGTFGYYRQINHSRIFLGLQYSSRNLDKYQIFNLYPDVDQTTNVSNSTTTFAMRVYPELYISIFEFFFEGGAGMNSIKATTKNYDRILQTNYNTVLNNVDRQPIFYGGFGLHVPVTEVWFLTAKAQSYYGTTIEFYSKKSDIGYVDDTSYAFDLKAATYRAASISLSLSFLF